MNCNLFFDLHQLVTIPSLFTISEKDFFFFLIGGFCNENLYEYDNKEISCFLAECKTKSDILLSTKFGRKFKKTLKLHLESKITLNDLIYTKYEKRSEQFKKTMEIFQSKTDEVSALYDKYQISFPHEDKEESLDRAISRLFALCIIEDIPPLFASYKNQKLKPTTISSTFGRDDDVKKLHYDLSQYHKIILSGELGSGKTHFIKYCLDKWDIEDYCYISYSTDIETTLSQIRYRDINGYEYFESSDKSLFNKNYSSSLLIIDNMYFSKDFEGELKYLANMKINIIIITIHSVSIKDIARFYYYELPILPAENIFEIFESDSGLSLADETQKSLLSELTHSNPLLTSLIAYQCKKAILSTDQQDIADKINQLLLTIKEMNTHIKLDFSYNNIFKHPYDKNSLDLIGHVKSIYAPGKNIHAPKKNIHALKKDNRIRIKNNLTNGQNIFIKKLCCFGYSPIPLSFVSTVILQQGNPNVMKELSELGLLTLTEETVQLSPLICYAIFTSGVSSDIYNPIANNLSKFLREYDTKLDIPYLSDILYTFFSTFYKEIKEQNNPRQNKTASRFNDWQELAYLIITYYTQIGNAILTQKVCNLIQYPDNLKNAHNALDKVLFEIINKMQMGEELDHMVSHIDKAIDKLNAFLCTSIDSNSLDNLYFSSPIRMTNIFLSSLDVALNQLYSLHLHQYDQSKNLIDAIDHRHSEIYRLLQLIDSVRLIIPDPPSEEQLCFYHICSWLGQKHYLCIRDLEGTLQYISTWKNMNYRIRGYAVIIFWQSRIAYCTGDGTFFVNTVLTNLDNLKTLIHDCKLIPRITFLLCFYAYINTAIVQHTFIHYKILQRSDIRQSLDHQTFHDLFHRAKPTKKELDTFMSYEDFILSSIEDPA